MAAAPRAHVSGTRSAPEVEPAFADTIAHVRALLEAKEPDCGAGHQSLLKELQEALRLHVASQAAPTPPQVESHTATSDEKQDEAWDPMAGPKKMQRQLLARRKRLRASIALDDHNTNPIVSKPVDSPVAELWRDGSWLPPALLPLPHADQFWSEWTWTGDIDRFEVVKSVRRSANRSGRKLTDDELELATLLIEAAEEEMQAEKFEEAQEMLLEALGICPSLPLAYYKLALCILAQGGPAALSAAKHPLRCAARLEVGNRVMRGSIDMVLRVITGTPTPNEYWTAQYPKAAGDIVALSSCVVKSDTFKSRLAAANRATKQQQVARAAEERLAAARGEE